MNKYFRVRRVLYYSSLLTIIAFILLYNTSDELDDSEENREISELTTFPLIKATKSMSDLGKMDDSNGYVLFLNQIPNCGGEVLVLLLQKLQGINNYRHVRLKRGSQILSLYDQSDLVSSIYERIREEAVPLSFDRNIYFVNFTKFDKQFPTYVNIIRDPIGKLISRSHFGKESNLLKCINTRRKCSLMKDIEEFNVPYFCGQDPRCRNGNSEWALQMAKNNVEKYYPVVGLLEDLNRTMTALEHYIPYYFRGAKKFYEKKFTANIPGFNSQIEVTKRDVLKSMLRTEYEFYDWIKARLMRQTIY